MERDRPSSNLLPLPPEKEEESCQGQNNASTIYVAAADIRERLLPASGGVLEYAEVILLTSANEVNVSPKGFPQRCWIEVELRKSSDGLQGKPTHATNSVWISTTTEPVTYRPLVVSNLTSSTKYVWAARSCSGYAYCIKYEEGKDPVQSDGEVAYGRWIQRDFSTASILWSSLAYAVHIPEGLIVQGDRDSLLREDSDYLIVRSKSTALGREWIILELQAQTRFPCQHFRLRFRGTASDKPRLAELQLRDVSTSQPTWRTVLDLRSRFGPYISADWSTESGPPGIIDSIVGDYGYVNCRIVLEFDGGRSEEAYCSYYLAEVLPS